MGKEEPLKLPPRVYRNPRISPDGKKVALDFESDGSHSKNQGTAFFPHIEKQRVFSAYDFHLSLA
jgi:hypothetical protein